MLAPPVATVEAASIKIIHLTLLVNPRMGRVSPSISTSAGHAAGGTRFGGTASRDARCA
jgi:hypothetical protein